MGQSLTRWQPSTDLSIEQRAANSTEALRWSTSALAALQAAKGLIRQWPHADPPDAQGWAGSIAAALQEYPVGVVEECVRMLPRAREFPPTVAAVTEWCDRRLKQHQGAIIGARKAAAERVEADRAARFSEPHRLGMLKRLQDLMRGILTHQRAREAE